MSTEPQKLRVLVFGATGKQGGSVLLHVAKQRKYNIRAFARNAEKVKKKYALQFEKARLNIDDIEIVTGNLDDSKSVEDALVDVDIVFLNTFFDLMKEKCSQEIERGMNVVNAINSKYLKSIKHIVYSSVPPLHDNPEAAAKQVIEKEIDKIALNSNGTITASFIYPTFYYENFVSGWPITKHLFTGKYHWWFLPAPSIDMKIAHVAIEDFGGIVAGFIKYRWDNNKDDDKDNNGYSDKDLKRVFAVSQFISFKEIMDTFSQVLGSKVYFEPLTLNEFENMPILNDFTKNSIKSCVYFNPDDNIGVVNYWTKEIEQEIPKCKYLFSLASADNNDEMKTCKTWAKENKDGLANGEMTTVLGWMKRIAKAKTFVKKPLVSLSIIVALSGTALYYYDKKYQTFGLFQSSRL